MKPKQSRPEEVERLAFSLGFSLDRQRKRGGSHRIYYHPDGRRAIISFHSGDVPSGTLRSIIKGLGITIEQFNEMI